MVKVAKILNGFFSVIRTDKKVFAAFLPGKPKEKMVLYTCRKGTGQTKAQGFPDDDDTQHDPLVKWLKTQGFQSCIRGSESRRGYFYRRARTAKKLADTF